MKLNKDILKKFHVLFEKVNEAVEDAPKLEFMAEGVLEGGTKIYTTAESWEAGVDIYVVNDEGEEIPVPAGEYVLEDGTVIIVEEAGVVAEINAKKDEEEKPEMSAEEVEQSEETEESYTKEDVLNLIEAAVSKLRTEFSSELEKKDKEIETLKAEFSKPLPKAPKAVEPMKREDLVGKSTSERVSMIFNNLK